MGVLEKVGLVVIVILFYQIKIRSCVHTSRAYTQDAFINHFKKMQRSDSCNNFSSSKIYQSELTKGQIPTFCPKDKIASICDIFQFPEVDYPLPSFRCPTFFYNYHPINKMRSCESHCSSDTMKCYPNIDMNGFTSKSRCLQDKNKWNTNKLKCTDNSNKEFQKQHFILQNNVAKNNLFDEDSLGIFGGILNQLNKKRPSRESRSKGGAEISENRQDALINPSNSVEIENVVVGSPPLSFDILSRHGTHEVYAEPSNNKLNDQSIESLTRQSTKPIINLIGNLLSTLNEILNLDENNLSKIDYENTTLPLPKVKYNAVASNENVTNQTDLSQKTLPSFTNYNETNIYKNDTEKYVPKLSNTQESQQFSSDKLELSLNSKPEYPVNSTLSSSMSVDNATLDYSSTSSNVNNITTTAEATSLITNTTLNLNTKKKEGTRDLNTGIVKGDILLFSDDLENGNMENSSVTNIIFSDDIDENMILLDSEYVEYIVLNNSSLANDYLLYKDYAENNQNIDKKLSPPSYSNETLTDLQITNNIEDIGQKVVGDEVTQPRDSDNRTNFNTENVNVIVNNNRINSEVNMSDTDNVPSGRLSIDFDNFTVVGFHGNYNNVTNTFVNNQFDDANVTSIISNFTQLYDVSDKLDNEITPMSSDIQTISLKNSTEPPLSNLTAKSPYKIENHVNVNIISLALDQIKNFFNM